MNFLRLVALILGVLIIALPLASCNQPEDTTDTRNTDSGDTTKAWIDDDLATLNDMTFFITGDALLSLMRYSFATFVNFTLAERYSLPNMYKLVDDGEWTHDFMSSTVANVYEDLNGNGKKMTEICSDLQRVI